jgi:hypothetical protein
MYQVKQFDNIKVLNEWLIEMEGEIELVNVAYRYYMVSTYTIAYKLI